MYSGIHASGGLVYIEWNIGQWRLDLCIVKHASGGLVYKQRNMPVAAWFIHSGISASGGLVYI